MIALALGVLYLDMRNDLQMPAIFPIVAVHVFCARLEHRIDALLFGQSESLHQFLFGHVGSKERAGIFQVPRVHSAFDQVSAQQQPTDLSLADLAARSRHLGWLLGGLLTGGAISRDSWQATHESVWPGWA